jgi:hypothetical protein
MAYKSEAPRTRFEEYCGGTGKTGKASVNLLVVR